MQSLPILYLFPVSLSLQAYRLSLIRGLCRNLDLELILSLFILWKWFMASVALTGPVRTTPFLDNSDLADVEHVLQCVF